MYSAIVFLPLLGAIIAGLFGRIIGAKMSEYVTCTFLVIAALLSWISLFQVGYGHAPPQSLPVAAWIESGSFAVDWAFRIDTLTSVMLVVVTTVSALVHIYSIGYMHHDPHRPRFFAYLSLFTFAMLMLVTSDNLLQMFFGWEGVGLASYLLIGFWYKRPSANAAAIKAFVVNRVGDFGFALGIMAVFFMFGSINFDVIFANAADVDGQTFTFLSWEVDAMTTICLLLFMGAMGKSAQFLLHTWLPDAMEGPTPVSALIHAATMVTAGVFLVARMSPLYELAPVAQATVLFFGAITAFFAATVGLVQNDIKRVIAYSTCSQLGYMFVAMGVGAYAIGMFHLFTHAFFKALLFLGAGSVIHAMSDEQDMRHMGGLRTVIPKTWAMMLIGTLALTGVGIPGLIGFAGFHSKDAVVEAAFAGHGQIAVLAFMMTVIAALFTSFYSWRLMFMTFHGRSRASADVMSHAHESPNVMLIPLYILALGAVCAGFVFGGQFIGHHWAEFWGASLFAHEDNHIMHEFHEVPYWVKWSPTVMMLTGLGAAYYCYIVSPATPARIAERNKPLYDFLLNKWYFDELYDVIIVKPAFAIGRVFWKWGDGRLIDGLGPDGVAARVLQATGRIVKLQSGYVYHYAFAMLIGIALFVTWYMFAGGVQ